MKTLVEKYILIFLLAIIFLNMFSTLTLASSMGNVVSGANSFISAGSGSDIDESKLKDLSNDVYNILLVIAFAVIAIVGIILGIRFMTCDVENKAEVKKALIVFFVGCVVTFGAFGIWDAIVSFLDTM